MNAPIGPFAIVAAWRLVPNTRSENPASVDLPVHLAGIGGGMIVTLQQSSYSLGVATLGTLFLNMEGHSTAGGFGWVVGIEAAAAVFVAAGSFILPATAAPAENVAMENVALEV